MRAQVQLLGITDPYGARNKLLQQKAEIIALANSKDKILIDLGGGCYDIEIKIFEETRIGCMVVLHLLVNVCDAMGANTVNTMAETVAPLTTEIVGGEGAFCESFPTWPTDALCLYGQQSRPIRSPLVTLMATVSRVVL